MFHSYARRLLARLNLADDLLGDPPAPEVPEPAAPHPHRRPLRFAPERRRGSVASRPAHCLSPVRRAFERQRREQPR